IIGLARNAHQPSHRLNEEIVSGPCCIWPGLAEASDGAIDDPGIDLLEALVIETILGEPTDLKVLDHNVRLGGELADELLPLGMRNVHRHRLFAAIAAGEIGRDPWVVCGGLEGERRAPGARVIATPWAFDLD